MHVIWLADRGLPDVPVGICCRRNQQPGGVHRCDLLLLGRAEQGRLRRNLHRKGDVKMTSSVMRVGSALERRPSLACSCQLRTTFHCLLPWQGKTGFVLEPSVLVSGAAVGEAGHRCVCWCLEGRAEVALQTVCAVQCCISRVSALSFSRSLLP